MSFELPDTNHVRRRNLKHYLFQVLFLDFLLKSLHDNDNDLEIETLPFTQEQYLVFSLMGFAITIPIVYFLKNMTNSMNLR